jgi:hypothetical protein
MKTSIIILTAIAISLTSFTTPTRNRDTKLAADRTGQQVIEAFRKEAPADYALLFPNLVDFHTIMGLNSLWYGDNLAAAKKDFADQYDGLDRAVYEAFHETITNGKQLGIDWKIIKFQQATLDAAPQKTIDASSLNVVFLSHGKEYSLRIDRALWIRGEFKVSQFLTLTQL